MSAVASLEQIPGGGPGQEREGNTGERGRNQGFEEVARNHFQPVKGQVRVRVWSMLNKYFDVPHLSIINAFLFALNFSWPWNHQTIYCFYEHRICSMGYSEARRRLKTFKRLRLYMTCVQNPIRLCLKLDRAGEAGYCCLFAWRYKLYVDGISLW